MRSPYKACLEKTPKNVAKKTQELCLFCTHGGEKLRRIYQKNPKSQGVSLYGMDGCSEFDELGRFVLIRGFLPSYEAMWLCRVTMLDRLFL